jgi:hypothetical protein
LYQSKLLRLRRSLIQRIRKSKSGRKILLQKRSERAEETKVQAKRHKKLPSDKRFNRRIL